MTDQIKVDIQKLIEANYTGKNPDYPKLIAFRQGKFLNELMARYDITLRKVKK